MNIQTEAIQLQIQINDWDRWLYKEGPCQMCLQIHQVYKSKYPNLVWHNEELEQFLVNNNIDYQIEFDEPRKEPETHLYIIK